MGNVVANYKTENDIFQMWLEYRHAIASGEETLPSKAVFGNLAALIRRTRKHIDEGVSPIALFDKEERAWTKEEELLLGTDADVEIASQLDRTVHQVKYRRQQLGIPNSLVRVEWTPWQIAKLGTESDNTIARELGVSGNTVLAKRKELNIAAYKPPTWPPEAIAILGTDTDSVIAEKLKKDPSNVSKKRRELGIPPFGTGGPKRKPTKD